MSLALQARLRRFRKRSGVSWLPRAREQFPIVLPTTKHQVAQNEQAPAISEEFARFPILLDDGRTIVESTIIIEHLMLKHGGRVRWLPDDPLEALEVRFLDRFFDNDVMTAMQEAVFEAIKKDNTRKDEAMAEARRALDLAYGWLEQRLEGRTWAAGETMSLADCAAAPSLFHADWVHTPSQIPFRSCGRTGRVSSPGLHSRESSTRRDRIGSTFRLGRRTGTEVNRPSFRGGSMAWEPRRKLNEGSWPMLRLHGRPLPSLPGDDRNPGPDSGPCTVKNDPERPLTAY